jgi:hypothetical protein
LFVRCETIALAKAFGLYCSSFITFNTFSRVSGLATPFPEMTRETVDFETPALNAMSLMV